MRHSFYCRPRIFLLLGAAMVAAAPWWAPRQAAAQQTAYPKVNTAISYQVDAAWPQRPAEAEWAAMPGIAVDKQDRVYAFTRAKPPIQVYDAGGKFLRSFGEGLVGSAHHIKLDSQGNVWVADMGFHLVMQFSPQGKLLKTLGTHGEPGCDDRHFDRPTDMVVTPEGDVFVTDGYGNARVAHFDKQGRFIKSWGKLGSGPGEFSLPHAIVRDSKGRLYVADRNNVRIQVFDSEGRFVDQWLNLLVPWGLWISDGDEIWACGSSPMTWRPEDGALGCPPKDQLIMKLDTSGKVLQLFTFPKGEDGKEKPGELNWVHGIALDSQGNVYLGDIIGQRAQKFLLVK